MKKIIYILLIVISFTSCNDDFLNTHPRDGIGSEQMWQTEEHAQLGVVSIYASLRTKMAFNMYGMNDCFTPIAWCMDRTGTTFDEYNQYRFCINSATARESMFKEKWVTLYKGITRANDAIDNIPGINMNDNAKKELIAEAKFGRALCYFDLLSFYSGHDPQDPGIPLYISNVHYNDAYLPRSKPGQIRSQMIKDLTEAIPDLPFASSEKGRANSAAARMLLGKIYLYNYQYEAAATQFGAVIKENGEKSAYELYNDYYLLFQLSGEDNKEGIFVIPNLDQQDYGSFMMMVYGNRSTLAQGGNVSVPSRELIDSYQKTDGSEFNWSDHTAASNQNDFWKNKAAVDAAFAGRDPRLEASVIRPWALFDGYEGGKAQTVEYRPNGAVPTNYLALRPNNGIQTYLWRKFVHTGTECPIRRNAPTDVPVMRYADLLLLFAEAKNESEGPVDSVYWAINEVRGRKSVEMPPLSGMDKSEMRRAIRRERAWELAGEGHSYGDYRRWYKYDINFDVSVELNYEITGFNTTNQISARVFQQRNWQFPIPQEEINLNKYLKPQNPGWEN